MTAATLSSAYNLPVSQHLKRAERDALRIHAEQILATITAQSARAIPPTVLELLCVDLQVAGEKLARDYAENEDRAFHQKEYEKWKEIAKAMQAQIEKKSEKTMQGPPHRMGSAAGTHLLGDITNLSYVLAMGAANILKDVPTVAAGFSAAATAPSSIVSTLASGMQVGQSYFALVVFLPLLIFELSCVFTHWKKREEDKKDENLRAKFLEHGRWMQLVNASVWIAAAVASIFLSAALASAAAVPIVAVMAVTILVTGMIRAIHQALELAKLSRVLKQYQEQLADEALPLEKKRALQLLELNLAKKIGESQSKLLVAIGFPGISVLGLVITAVGIAIGFAPFLLIGAAIVLAIGVATVVINRKAIEAAFKSVGEKFKNKKVLAESRALSESEADSDSDLSSLMVELSDSDSASEFDKGSVDNKKTPLEEKRQTKRAIASMARVHRLPTTSERTEVIYHAQRKTQQECDEAREEACRDNEEKEGI